MKTLNTTILANVETYLATQYAKRHPQREPVKRWDGVVVILVSLVVAMVAVGMGE